MNYVVSFGYIVSQILVMPYNIMECQYLIIHIGVMKKVLHRLLTYLTLSDLGPTMTLNFQVRILPANDFLCKAGIPFSKEIHVLAGLKKRFQNLNKPIDLLVRKSQQQRYPLKSTSKQICMKDAAQSQATTK